MILNTRKTIKVLGLMLAAALLGAMLTAAAVWAEDPIRLFVNGVEVHSDVPPQVINGRTMIPARALAEALGARVEWDANQRAVMVYALASGGNPTDLPSSGSSSSVSTSGSSPGSTGSNSGSSPGSNSNPSSGLAPSNGSNLNPGANSGSQSGSLSGSSPGSSPASQQTPGLQASWTGTWETNFGELVLVQTGTSVAGTYSYRNGRFTGTVEGNVLTGTWSESPSYAPPNDLGIAKLTMSAGGVAFTGTWSKGYTGETAGEWNGSRK